VKFHNKRNKFLKDLMVQREAKSQERGLRNRYRAGGAIGMYSDHVESQLFANF
jgi:hypothetical protein